MLAMARVDRCWCLCAKGLTRIISFQSQNECGQGGGAAGEERGLDEGLWEGWDCQGSLLDQHGAQGRGRS